MRKANVSLTMDNRLDICNKKKSRPTMTNDDLAHWAKEEFNLLKLPSASTISKILKRGSQGLIKPDEFKSRKRARKGKWPDIEEAILLWMTEAQNQKLSVNWSMIKSKATDYAEKFEINDFKCSNGWIDKFAHRNSIKMQRVHDEAAKCYTQ